MKSGFSFSLLFLIAACLLVAASHAFEFKGWIVIRSDKGASLSKYGAWLRESYDFRGFYGQDKENLVGLLWGSADDAEALKEAHSEWTVKHRIAAPKSGRYVVLQLEGDDDVELEVALALVGKNVLFRTKDVALVNVFDPSRLTLPKNVEVIPVPTSALKPLIPKEKTAAYAIFQNRPKLDDKIEECVSKVNRDELYENVRYLSEEFHTRQSYSDDIRDAQAWLENEYHERGLQVSTHSYNSAIAPNVVAELIGAVNPSKIVVIGAHYDSRTVNSGSTTDRAPGADDNGSGSSAVLEIARVLTSSNVTFANTIRFISFSGEEQGLLGSEAYASMIADRGDDVIAMFNSDMLGYRIPGTSPSLGMKDKYITEWLVEMTINITNTYVPSLIVGWSSSCCSDYISFFNEGYPAAGYFENLQGASSYPDYHTSNDVVENVDFDQMTLHTQAILAAVMTFAEPL